MVVTQVHVYVKKEHIDDFIQACITNHNSSIKEPGNMRFDVLQDTTVPARFVLYEAYEDEATAAAHKETSHYLEWREKVADWMEKPRVGIKFNVIRP